MNKIKDYFSWLISIIDEDNMAREYSFLLRYLFNQDFYWILPFDANRAKDGLDLRWRYEYEEKKDISNIINKPCSMLEMMVALSIKIEEQIMEDDEYGIQAGKWFWKMIENLGYFESDDELFDAFKADEITLRFLERQYFPNGKGSLFTIHDCDIDLRTVDIWCQTCWYLNEIIDL